jgi:hypothetical protein
METLLHKLIMISGVGHIVLCAVSLLIPKFLQWKTHLRNLQPLLRQMFWTYAAYILMINFAFGIVSIFGSDELLDHSFLARAITFFITAYWLGRILIQFFYFDRSQAPKGTIYTLGEVGLVMLFFLFMIIYLAAFLHNMSWI